MRHRLGGWAPLLLLTSLLLTVGPVASAASGENYGDYSLMDKRHAGQFYADGSIAGQWAWTPHGDESEVRWGDPAKWPPDSAERFIHTGEWVLLDGWRSFGSYYVQRVHRELIGDGSCQNMTPIPSDGDREHYVLWRIPPQAYCLQAWGTITEQSTGKTVDFYHSQVWSPPSTCENTFFGVRTCISQRESWSDNNGAPGAPIARKLERTVFLARGIGMGFLIDQTYPYPWRAELRSDWEW